MKAYVRLEQLLARLRRMMGAADGSAGEQERGRVQGEVAALLRQLLDPSLGAWRSAAPRR